MQTITKSNSITIFKIIFQISNFILTVFLGYVFWSIFFKNDIYFFYMYVFSMIFAGIFLIKRLSISIKILKNSDSKIEFDDQVIRFQNPGIGKQEIKLKEMQNIKINKLNLTNWAISLNAGSIIELDPSGYTVNDIESLKTFLKGQGVDFSF